MPHQGGWGWRRVMNYFLFSRPARKGGVVDFANNLMPHMTLTKTPATGQDTEKINKNKGKTENNH